ncbi:TPA: hypothetical protein IYI17_002353, partial [Enterococcus faecium]|nr:hypothetical protein [Enterococcus faecium]HAR1691857.1 hypothetical protein [Enterococcus faecium]HCA5334386.1 hypothetical protein [Enterococcus faecium]HDT7884663.1 hypothetical protein [Enterococcus faecium]
PLFCECVVVTLFYRRDFLFSIYTKYFTLSSNIKTSTKLICKLFKLDKISNIDDVKSKILTRKVSEPVKLTAQDKKNGIVLYGDDAKYNYNWDTSSEAEVLSIPTTDTSGEKVTFKINFITAISKLEYGKQKKRDNNDQYLPKK